MIDSSTDIDGCPPAKNQHPLLRLEWPTVSLHL
jgi:hypothetical protein